MKGENRGSVLVTDKICTKRDWGDDITVKIEDMTIVEVFQVNKIKAKHYKNTKLKYIWRFIMVSELEIPLRMECIIRW